LVSERLSTGISELDQVLFGGFPTNTLNIIMGAPGTGKTILAEQITFANSSPQSPALYLTTLSEPLEKFISHGQTYAFFDPSKVAESVFYEDLGLIVRERGIAALPDIVTEMLIARRPRLIVIDSFKALMELIEESPEQRTVLFDLASVLGAYQCTSFIVGEYTEEMMADLPEFAVADAILSLLKHATGVREHRFLKIEKLRGSQSLPGMHAFAIRDSGIEVFPRLLTPQTSPDYDLDVERVSTGIKGLDDMVAKGFWRGSTTLVAGPNGSGKTVIGLHFIREGILRNEPGVYVGFQENPVQLARIITNFGWDSAAMFRDENFEHMYRSPVEMQLDNVATELMRRVRGGKIKRVVIDALGDLRKSSSDEQRFSEFMYALTQWFAVQNVTCLMTFGLHYGVQGQDVSDEEISNLSDNIVLLRFQQGPEVKRAVRIIKTRGSTHDHREQIIDISNKGMRITPR